MWTAGVASAQACCVACSETFKCKCAARPLSGGAGPSETDNAHPSSSPALCTANHPTSAWPAMPVRYTWLCPISAPGAGTGRMERQTRGKAPAGSKARRTAKRTKRTETPAGSRPLPRQRGLPVRQAQPGRSAQLVCNSQCQTCSACGIIRALGCSQDRWGRRVRRAPRAIRAPLALPVRHRLLLRCLALGCRCGCIGGAADWCDCAVCMATVHVPCRPLRPGNMGA
jgi:hypothetical protein